MTGNNAWLTESELRIQSPRVLLGCVLEKRFVLLATYVITIPSDAVIGDGICAAPRGRHGFVDGRDALVRGIPGFGR